MECITTLFAGLKWASDDGERSLKWEHPASCGLTGCLLEERLQRYIVNQHQNISWDGLAGIQTLNRSACRVQQARVHLTSLHINMSPQDMTPSSGSTLSEP